MYAVEPAGDDVRASIEAIPTELLAGLAEVRVALALSPWTVGEPYNLANPDGSRVVSFGPEGVVTIVFGVIERERLVTILAVVAI